MAVMMSLTACSSDSAAPAAGFSLNASSGSKVDVTGKWIGVCYRYYDWDTTAYIDAKDVLIFGGGTITSEVEKYTSSGSTCTGTATRGTINYSLYNFDSAGKKIATFPATMGTEKVVLGWHDNSSSTTTAPNSLAGPPLAGTPTASTINFKYSLQTASDTYGDYRWILFVDDSDKANGNFVLYYGLVRNKTGTYPDYLKALDYLTKAK